MEVSLRSRKSWLSIRRPSNEDLLDYYEKLMLSGLSTPYAQYMIPIELDGQTFYINTLETFPVSHSFSPLCPYPLVMLHGFGGGLGVFVKNIDALASRYKVYTFDSLGCGKSSRPRFPTDTEGAENYFVESIEAWRKSMKLEQFVLLGHSFGGYQATCYAIRYPHRVKYLVLADPWGFPERPAGPLAHRYPLWIRVMSDWLRPLPPFALLRALGPLGLHVLMRVRSDVGEKFADILESSDVIYRYIYHLNVMPPSAELGFAALTWPYGFARRPLIRRITDLHPDVPISFIYGVRSMMDYSIGERTKRLRPASHVEWHVLNDCGHHVYCENHYEFNSLVLQTAEYLEHPDSGLDSGSEAVDMSDVADAVVPDGVDGEDGPDCDAVAACEESVRRECVGGLFDHLGVDSAAAAQCVSTSPLGRAASSQYDEVDA
eukprot:m.25700 g.25700  ORF g.25700 m.25700 type:complete len:432 (+) comp4199_c0_seq2:45-1340(+)